MLEVRDRYGLLPQPLYYKRRSNGAHTHTHTHTHTHIRSDGVDISFSTAGGVEIEENWDKVKSITLLSGQAPTGLSCKYKAARGMREVVQSTPPTPTSR